MQVLQRNSLKDLGRKEEGVERLDAGA